MEAILKNLGNTVEVLAVSQTVFVNEWDNQTVVRAFQWARYCEQVYTRFHTTPSIRAALETRLNQTNERLAETFSGYRFLTLSDLAQCQHRLFAGLLRNPVVPLSVIKSLFDKFPSFEDGGSPDEQSNETDSDLIGFIRRRSACDILCSLAVERKESCGLSRGSQVQGKLLLQRIEAVQCRPGNDSYARTLLDSFLQDSGGLGNFSEVIAAALLSGYREDATAQDFLLNWLQGHRDVLHSMCQSLQPALCTKLSQQCPTFKLIYWDSLKKWASSLEYNVSDQVWVQKCSNAVSFKSVEDRVKSLWSSGSPLKEEMEKDLEVLKQTDGDFEVHGLSVWTDLLNYLK
ncbi:hypothetical protein P4O66_002644 [Electrophorus voltai]|uniref:FA complementation group F n=1 Tax=Electrophorus voltai TaxID=2609070 RepID=A0AAD9DP33_9TELE|nr:hypothetical protein P4O66_002644 [Electrophorus voltai]